MEAIFKIQPKELDEKLLLQIKKMFEGKTVTIIISTEMDETSYLTSNPANEKHLVESMASEPLVSFTPDEFEKHSKELLKQKKDKKALGTYYQTTDVIQLGEILNVKPFELC